VSGFNGTLRFIQQARCRAFCALLPPVAVLWLALMGPASAETLPEALVRTYQGNPQLNAERARLRGTDEGVPQALSGYRPQLMATLTGGLQQVRNLLPDNTIQTATLRTWSIGFTVTQILFNGFKTANMLPPASRQFAAQ
jgi:outer membrane protein